MLRSTRPFASDERREPYGARYGATLIATIVGSSARLGQSTGGQQDVRTIYLVAHPEAEHHVRRLVGGWYDSDLTPAGERDAQRIAAKLRALIPPENQVALYSSDLSRTWRTAEVIGAALGAVPHPDARLREKSYGEADGKPQEWLDQRFAPPPKVGDRLGHTAGIKGVETNAALAARIYEAMDAAISQELMDTVIVTHVYAVTFAIASWIRMPAHSLGYVNFRVKSGSITTLREDDFFHNRQVVALGATKHLD